MYRSLRPPLDLAAIRYVQRHHGHGLDPADVVSDILASLEEFVMDGNGPSAYFEDSLIVPMLVKQVRLRLKRAQRQQTRRGDVALSSRNDRDRKAGQGFAQVETADLQDFLDRTVAARVGSAAVACLHLAEKGCSLEEMGKRLGISRATAQRRLKEARAVAKAYLRAENLAPPESLSTAGERPGCSLLAPNGGKGVWRKGRHLTTRPERERRDGATPARAHLGLLLSAKVDSFWPVQRLVRGHRYSENGPIQ